MSMLVPASNLDKAIGIGAAVLSIAATATRLGRNLVKKAFTSAKGKVDDLFDRFKKRPPGFENTAEHIFGNKNLFKHKLEPLLDKFGGDQLKATDAIFKATKKIIGKGSLVASFERTIRVKGFDLVVRGKVVNGVVRVSSAFKP